MGHLDDVTYTADTVRYVKLDEQVPGSYTQRVRPAFKFGPVFLGGALGTALRAALLSSIHGAAAERPDINACCLIALNTVGVFIACWMLAGPLTRPRYRSWRPFLITGLLGGLTSYSSLMTSGRSVLHLGLVAVLSFGLAALILGVTAASFGYRVGGQFGIRQ